MNPALLLLLAAPWTFQTVPEDPMGRPETNFMCVLSDDNTSNMCLIRDTEEVRLMVRTPHSLTYAPKSFQRLLVRLDDAQAAIYRVAIVHREQWWGLVFVDESSPTLIRALLQAPRRVRVEVQLADGTSHVITFHTQERP